MYICPMYICPKCKQIVIATGKDYVLCCDEVIFIIDETYNSENEIRP